MFVAALLLVAISASSHAIDIPTTGCEWRGADYGEMNQCEGDEIPVGACGSGYRDDCSSGSTTEILCCDMPDYVYGNCLETQGDFGEQISCAEGTIVEGICGSGKREDCDGSSHIIKCCEGLFLDGTTATHDERCYWLFGTYGEDLRCNFENEALFGICGSGMYADCVEKGAARSDAFHGIQCCGLIADNSTVIG